MAMAMAMALLPGLSACDPNDPNVSRIFHKEPRGVGLTRASFGPLNPQVVPAATSLCNQNIGLGIDKWLLDTFGALVDKPRNYMGSPDQTLEKEELTRFFKLTTATDPLVRVISRTPRSIDFWFFDDGVVHAQEATLAAEDYCRGRGRHHARYIGFSFKCGQVIQVPFTVNGNQSTVTEEERIVAFDCS